MIQELNIALGSQHIALLEPMRLEFQTNNETITAVKADFGYVHRGIERACASKFKFKQVGYVVSRVCGLCSITHASGYTFAIEDIFKAEIPKRAKYLRILALELDRIHSHLLCLSHTAESAGFEALFMNIMKHRELVMEAQESLSGNRIHFDYLHIGGVNRDIDVEKSTFIIDRLTKLEEKLKEIDALFRSNYSLSLRYKGIGAMSQEDALLLNATGPQARATGLPWDIRAIDDVLPYGEVGFSICTSSGGDIHARNDVRLQEVKNSLSMAKNVLQNLPEGAISTKIKGNPDGEAISRIEAPRGELSYIVIGEKKPILKRVRIKTPTYSNVASFVHIMKNQQYGDIPAIMASFDPCMSCTAK